MAKDKEKQLFKNIDDKAITFQRAVFIVCNLKRLIKRPKKDDKLIATRKRSGDRDGDERDRPAWGATRLSRKGARLKEPVRRAFTLPSMLCSSLQVALQNSARNSGVAVRNDERGISNNQDNQEGSSSSSSSATIRTSSKVRLSPTEYSSCPPIDRLLPHTAASSTQLGLGSLSCMATPTRTPLSIKNQPALERISGGNFVANFSSSSSSSNNNTAQKQLQSMLATAAPAQAFGQSTSSRQASQAGESASHWQAALSGQQLLCPIWAQFMAQLDIEQAQPREQSLRELAHLLAPPARLPFLLGNEQQQFPNQPNPRLLVSRDPVAVAIGNEKSASPLSVGENHTQRRSSNDELEKRAIQYQSSNSPIGSIQLSCTRKASAASPGSDVAHHASTRNNQPVDTLDSQEKCSSSKQQPMKRFSSALCLANDELDAQQQKISPSTATYDAIATRRNWTTTSTHQVAPSGKATRIGKNVQRQQQLAARKHHISLVPSELEFGQSSDRLRRQSAGREENSSTNVDQQALFSAVECNQLERVKSILSKGRVNVNSLNGDRLTCLDIAVLQRNVEMVRVLQQHKAKESAAYLTREGRADQLYQLYMEARRLVEDLSHSLSAFQAPYTGNGPSNCPNNNNQNVADHFSSALPIATANNHQQPLMLATGSLLSSALFEEKQRQLQYWKRRLDLFMLMRYQFERLQVPSPPELIILQVVGENSLGVKIVHSLQSRIVPINASSLASSNIAQNDPPALDNNARKPDFSNEILPSATVRAPLVCLQGERCSHWILGDAIPHLRAPWGATASASGSFRQQHLATTTGLNCEKEDERRAHRLAVFNQLLGEQLQLLSQQQHEVQQQQLPAAGQSGTTNQRHQKHHQLLLLSQSSSTESAQSRLSGPEQTSHEPDASNLCPSLAYRLMTAAASGGGRNHAHHQHYYHGRGAWNGLDSHHHHHHHHQQQQQQQQMWQQQYEVIITKYRIEWATNESFEPIAGSLIIYNTNIYPLECQIEGLVSGQPYYVRVASGNHAGFCETRLSSPERLAPSSWRQVDGLRKRRCEDEEVFRKFTKLILLNKHILDDRLAVTAASSGSSVSNVGAALLSSTSSILAKSSTGHGSGQQQAQLQAPGSNKSSLINMLMLDATQPSSNLLTCEEQLDLQQQQQFLDGNCNLLVDNPQAVLNQSSSQSSAAISAGSSKDNHPSGQQPLSMRKNLKNFFQPSSFKFHKLNNQNKRGLYLCTVVVYSSTNAAGNSASQISLPEGGGLEGGGGACNHSISGCCMNANDKIVVTNDDRLPVMEVLNELVSPAALMSDFYWLLKINGTQWMDIKRLRQQLQKSHSSSTLHLRIKLLYAIEQIQVALNLEDIGRLFYRPVQAHDGSIVICTCRQVSSTKMVSSLSTKWASLHKIIPRHLRNQTDLNAAASTTCAATYQQLNSTSTCAGSSSVSVASTSGLEPSPGSTQHSGSSSRKSTLSSGLISAGQPAIMTEGEGVVELCEHCQYQLAQRRSTMASGSSNSSLASSDDSQWSQVRQQLAGGSSLGATSALGATSSVAGRCTCGIGACSEQAQVLCAVACSSSSSSARSASLMTSGSSSVHQQVGVSAGTSSIFGLNARHSQPAASRSSTYLMMASLSLYELLLYSLSEIVHFHRSSTRPLKRGLYLGFLQLQATVESMRLLVPRTRPNMVPCVRVRDNPHVSREEWQLLKRFGSAFGRPAREAAASAGQDCSGVSTHLQVSADAARLLSAPEMVCARGRAKSVSPGLLKEKQQNAAAHLSASSERITPKSTSGLTCEQLQSLSGAAKQAAEAAEARDATSKESLASSGNAHSDSELPHQQQRQQVKESSAITQPLHHSSREAANYVDKSGSSNSLLNARNFSGSASNLSVAATRGHHFNLSTANSLEETFVRLVGSAARRLLSELRAKLPKVYEQQHQASILEQQTTVTLSSILQSLNDEQNNRIYHIELIELSNQVSFILLLPACENVCPVTSQEKSNILADNRDYMLLPLQIFETIHISTYEPDLLGKYSRLSAILETDLIVAQHDHRQAFSSNELKSTKSRVSHLQDMVNIADDFWRKLRWIVDVVSFARDKNPALHSAAIKLGSIWRYFELQTPKLTTSAAAHTIITTSTAKTTTTTMGSDQSFLSSAHRQIQQQTVNGQSGSSLPPDPQTGPIRSGGQKQQQPAYGCSELLAFDGDRASEKGLTEQQRGSRSSNQSASSKAEVKRTSSARDESYQTRMTGHSKLNLPEIQLTSGLSHSSALSQLGVDQSIVALSTDSPIQILSQPSRSREQQQIASSHLASKDTTQTTIDASTGGHGAGKLVSSQNSRRHSSAASTIPSSPAVKIISGQYLTCELSSTSNSSQCEVKEKEKQQRQAYDEDGATSWINLRLRDATEDEEAIYAYHISLKDATRAAAQRKSSQLSTKPILDEEPHSQVPAGSGELSKVHTSSRQESSKRTKSGKKLMKNIAQEEKSQPGDLVMPSSSLEVAYSQDEQEGAERSDGTQDVPLNVKLRHLKTTNPFLNDSLESLEK